MRNTRLVLALVAVTALLAQPASSYRITRSDTPVSLSPAGIA